MTEIQTMESETVTTSAGWIAFLRRRVEEEKRRTLAVAAHGWWDLTAPDARRFGIAADGRVLAAVFTGRRGEADHEVALHILSNQPGRTLEDLDAKEQFLDRCEGLGNSIPPQLLSVVRQFAEPFHDHPDHPVRTPEAP